MNLAALQQHFRGWLMEESAAAAGQLGGARASAGLSVYLNNYRSQLLVCLRETYPTVRVLLGDEAFNAAAATHIDQVPPSSWTLDAYPDGFPATLEALYADDPVIGELAVLELALANAFVGPDAPSVALDALEGIDWDSAVLTLVPTFRLLPARTNAAALRAAIAAGGEPPAVERLAQPSSLALWRRDFTPMYRTLEAGEADALGQVAAGASFGALCAQLAGRHGEADGTAMAGAWLGQWLRDGLLASIR